MPEAKATDAPAKPALLRSLTLAQGTAINIIDMVGIGPFVVMSMVVGALQGPACVLAWLLGALLAYTDGMVWSELGAKWPEAGGSYVFLGKLYDGKILGRLMPFLFVWQTLIQAPLTMASASLGFSQYLGFLVPLDPIAQKAVSGGLVVLVVIVLYRKIHTVGNISMILGAITLGTITWIIASGIFHFNAAQVWRWDFSSYSTSTLMYAAIGHATLKAVYSYLGYYNVVNLGGEIRHPERNIPRSIFLSVTIIALLYVGMQVALLGNMSCENIQKSPFVFSTYMAQVYGHKIGVITTCLILLIASSSLFALTLGYSRVPYAAARNGDFFPVFARLHPKHHFPHVSLLVLGALGLIISLRFRMEDVIPAIITMRIVIQFLAQSIGLIRWHILKPKDERPYKMPLYPWPALLSIAIWLFIFLSSPARYLWFATGIIVVGLILFVIKEQFFPRPKED